MSTEITRDLLIDTMQRAYTRRGDVTERARLGAQADAILTLLAERDRQVAERAFDEAVRALAWAMANGPDPLAYVRAHNPYRIEREGGEE